MGVAIRLTDVVIQNDSLPVAQIPYGGITDGLVLASHLRRSLALSADISGNNTSVGLNGSPVFKPSNMACVNLSGLTTGADTTGNKSRTMCVVAKVLPGFTGSAFLMSNYSGSHGCSLFVTAADGLRCQVITNNNGVIAAPMPQNIPGLSVNINDWFFASLVVDVESGKATLHIPGKGFKYSINLLYPLFESNQKTLLIGRSSATTAFTGESNIAYATYHNRALTETEIMIQHSAARSYCSAVGVTLA